MKQNCSLTEAIDDINIKQLNLISDNIEFFCMYYDICI